MTRYTVVWAKAARDELIDLWLQAANRNEVTAAVHRIDQQLAEDAPRQGAELSEGLRAVLVPPLRVLFAVGESDRVAEVLLVRLV
ncbi:MAG: hypothetical protein ABR915_16290 [Thermoguttaceae bacterium]|jgi:plasmid stabilization system protein ParE